MTAVATIENQPNTTDFAGLMRLCDALVPTGFLPKHVTTPGQAAAIILAGRELGMEPMLALRSITMVQGKIVVAADAQLALFKARGGRATFTTLDDAAAVLVLTHPNGDKHTESFSMKDANTAGLTGNPTWKKFPKAMLRSRCITAGLKSIGFEPTSGVYDPDEAQHFIVPESGTVAAGESPAKDGEPSHPSTTPNPDTLPTMRIGKRKGEHLSAFTDSDLEGAVKWCKEKGKFADAVKEMEMELDSRGPVRDSELEEDNRTDALPSTVSNDLPRALRDPVDDGLRFND